MKHRVNWHIDEDAYQWIRSTALFSGRNCHNVIEEMVAVTSYIMSICPDEYESLVKSLMSNDDSEGSVDPIMHAIEFMN